MLVCKHDGLPVHAGPNGSYFHDNPHPLLRTIARDIEEEKVRNIRKMDEAGTLPLKVDVDLDPSDINQFSTRPIIRNHQLHPKGCQV